MRSHTHILATPSRGVYTELGDSVTGGLRLPDQHMEAERSPGSDPVYSSCCFSTPGTLPSAPRLHCLRLLHSATCPTNKGSLPHPLGGNSSSTVADGRHVLPGLERVAAKTASPRSHLGWHSIYFSKSIQCSLDLHAGQQGEPYAKSCGLHQLPGLTPVSQRVGSNRTLVPGAEAS